MKKNVLIIGSPYKVIDNVDFEVFNVHVLIDRFTYRSLSKVTLKCLESIKTFRGTLTPKFDYYTDCLTEIDKLFSDLISEYGEFSAIIAPYEHATYTAGFLRSKYGIEGISEETALICRDKFKMKEALKNTDVRVVPGIVVNSFSDIEKIKYEFKDYDGKIVMKPISSMGSKGVLIFGNLDELLEYVANNDIEERHLIESFISAPVLHIDGIVRQGELKFFCPCLYLETCYAYEHENKALPSISLSDEQQIIASERLTRGVLEAIGLRDGVFHLEAFLLSDGSLIFLEIGCRAGGAHINDMYRETCGCDLFVESILADMQQPSRIKDIDRSSWPGAQFTVGRIYTKTGTREVSKVRGISGLDQIPNSVVFGETRNIGSTINSGFAMMKDHASIFILKGESYSEILADLRAIEENFTIQLERA
ncbi:acetyl-CoA carboxylase biotin carboxylase subunit family protein [Pseudoalteromonas piscicida]|uniref:ATP-grasp domain-containing protein n=1 Tax=Pseudoalteromonas piscicida TaxID=43662 RepID=UPI000E35B974|nr:ATP-grasp domain-containing protein [Pseudoalteromonas piscicida]AXQ99548.1 ATP-grasp domain-containing protein [Pseudoalteromonas piscicida]